MKKIILALVVVILGGGSLPALSADIAAGKTKADQLCKSCHGPDGKATIPLYPHLAGQNQMYLEKQLKDFRSGTRKDPAMQGFAKMLSNDDIVNMSAYYSSLK